MWHSCRREESIDHKGLPPAHSVHYGPCPGPKPSLPSSHLLFASGHLFFNAPKPGQRKCDHSGILIEIFMHSPMCDLQLINASNFLKLGRYFHISMNSSVLFFFGSSFFVFFYVPPCDFVHMTPNSFQGICKKSIETDGCLSVGIHLRSFETSFG